MSKSKAFWRRKSLWKWAVLGLVVIGLSIASRFLPFGEWIQSFTNWVKEQGAWGVALFAGGYVLGAMCFFPASLLSLAGGATFGLWGIPLALGSATVAASLSFLVARHLARGAIEKRAKQNEKFQAIDAAVSENGWKIVLLLRLSLLVPFTPANYFFGLSGVKFWPYVLATLVGIAPTVVLYVCLGHLGKATLSGGGEATPQQLVLLGIGLVATVAVTVYLMIIAKKALKKKGPKTE